MNLSNILRYRYPDGAENYTLQDDGSGPYIAYWNEAELGPLPTPEQLASWELPAAKWAKRREMRRAHDEEFHTLFSLDGEYMESEAHWLIVREMRVGQANLTAAESAKVNQRQTLRSNLISLIDRVGSATTPEQVEAVSWTTVVAAKK